MNVRRSIAKATVVLTAAALSLGLSSCSMRGFDEPTDQVYNPAVGVNNQDSDVDVLNAVIVSGSDGSGTLVATLVNNDQENDDTLTGINAGGDDQVSVTAPSKTTIEAGSLLSLVDEGGAKVTGDAVDGRHLRHADVRLPEQRVRHPRRPGRRARRRRLRRRPPLLTARGGRGASAAKPSGG